jgi:hypothetical protein
MAESEILGLVGGLQHLQQRRSDEIMKPQKSGSLSRAFAFFEIIFDLESQFGLL